MRVLRALAIVLFVLGVAAWVLFPTDELVRAVLARVPLPNGMAIVFRRAVLRPWGLRLDEPTLRRGDGTAVVALDWIRLRPTLAGFWRDRTGRPWHVAVGACRGTVDADVDVDPQGAHAATVRLAWTEVDLGRCPSLAAVAPDAVGVVGGTADVAGGIGRAFDAHGTLTVRETTVPLSQTYPGVPDVLVKDGRTDWTYHGERLVLENLDVRAVEGEVTGGGSVQLRGELAASGLDLRLTLRTFEPTPPGLARVVAALPPAPGEPDARRLVVRGTIRDPQLVREAR